MIGIPIVILLLVLAVSLISGLVDSSSPMFQDLKQLGQRMMSYFGSGDMMQTAARMIVLLICFPVHECAHAWTADKLGDPTGRLQGRISLNPLRHLDPWGTVMIFLLGVGYAKPVPVRTANFKNRKRDFAITSLAGPASNLLMAVLSLVLIRILSMIPGSGNIPSMVISILMYAAYINIALAVFNLIPIPPLDGSRVLTALLPDGAYNAMLKYERYMMIFLLMGMLMLSRAGYSPVGDAAWKIFRVLYRVITGG